MQKTQLTDEVVLPVMQKHNIDREEAEARLHLLFESGILYTGGPDDPNTQRMIDDFLAAPSDILYESVAFEKVLTQCMNNKDLVRQYDRLRFTNFAKALRNTESGKPPKNMQKLVHDFGEFVRKTIFAKLVNDIDQQN